MESSASGEPYPSGSSYKDDSPPPSNRPRLRQNGKHLPGSHEALEAAQEYQRRLAKSSRSTVKVLNQCCVSGTYVMTLPSNFCKKMMPHGKASISLRDKTGHQWPMKWNWSQQPVIGAGWKAFCVHHDLVIGDVLVFQKEESSPKTIRFNVEIFKRRRFGPGAMVRSRAHRDARNNSPNIVQLAPKKEDDLEIEELLVGTGGGANGGDIHDHNYRRNDWVEDSCDEDDEAAAAAAAAAAEGIGGGGEAAEKQLDEPVVTLVVKKTRSAAESEDLGVSLKVHSSKLERISRSVLGSRGSIVQGSFDGLLKAKVSKEELRKVLGLMFPPYDATPF